jgi:hypothetical protein
VVPLADAFRLADRVALLVRKVQRSRRCCLPELRGQTTVNVTVVSCVYGPRFDRFIPGWAEAIAALDPAPEAVIVASDRPRVIPGVTVIEPVCTWRHPQACYLQAAVSWATTEWVWIVDIDDLALPDGLAGIEAVGADVWQMGYLASDGAHHLPPSVAAAEYLAEAGNPYAAGSAFRTAAFRAVGGFTDVAFQDWSLWRRLATAGATVEASNRTHYRYIRHPRTRSAVELTAGRRAEHVAEMIEREIVHA